MKLFATKLLLLLLIFVTIENVGYGQTKLHASTTATTPVYLFNNQAKTIPLKGLATKKIASIRSRIQDVVYRALPK